MTTPTSTSTSTTEEAQLRFDCLGLATRLVESANHSYENSPWIPSKEGMQQIAERYFVYITEGRITSEDAEADKSMTKARDILRGNGDDRSDRDTLSALWRLLLPDECGTDGTEERPQLTEAPAGHPVDCQCGKYFECGGMTA